MENFVTYLLAFTVTATLIHFLSPQAIRIGLVDRPNGRKQHSAETPLVGGLAIFFGFYIPIALADLQLAQVTVLVLCSLSLIFIGILDDIRDLSPKPRLIVQVTAASAMCLFGGVVLADLGHLGVDGSFLTLGAIAIPFTVFATVGVINAINMSDGLDGLSGSLTLVALGGMALLAAMDGHWIAFEGVVTLSCAVAGFLLFNARVPNRARALVFLGDSGSMFLGFALAWFLISFSQGADRIMSPVTALWLLAVPLCDTVGILLRRILKGRSPFAADREHFHHILQLAGFGVSQVNIIIGGIAVVCMSIGVLGHVLSISDSVMFGSFLALFGVYFAVIARAWKVMRFLRRQLSEPSTFLEQQHKADADRIIYFKAKSSSSASGGEQASDIKEPGELEETLPLIAAKEKATKNEAKNKIVG